MKKIKLVIEKFIKTLKDYINYLMKVGYKELFANTVVIFCLIVLSAFVYIPIDVVKSFIKDTLLLFAGFGDTFDAIFYWFFNIISALSAIFVFMILFNKRFESVKNAQQENNKIKEKNEEGNDDLELPKSKK